MKVIYEHELPHDSVWDGIFHVILTTLNLNATSFHFYHIMNVTVMRQIAKDMPCVEPSLMGIFSH